MEAIKQMDATEQIQLLKEFFQKNYEAELLENTRKGQYFIIIDFAELSKFNKDLADQLLDHPEEILKGAQLSIEQLPLSQTSELTIKKPFTVRFKNLPRSEFIRIREIRSEHLGNLLMTEGTVRNKTDVRPHVTSAKFECPACGNILPMLQLDKNFREPTRCACGRKGKFRLVSKDLVDAQRIVVEEATEQIEGGEQPKRLNIFLQNDLVSPISERRTNPGSRIRLVGILKEIPITLKTGAQSTEFDIYLDANFIEPIEEDFNDITINPEELEEIKKLSEDPGLVRKFTNSIVPSIFGHEIIKESLILQLLGGVRKTRGDGVVTRGDIHILLVGDPGSGKSQMLKRISRISPKGRFISGKGVSGAGLTATVVKDEFLQGWSLEAGALVLANGGVCCIDELDKMTDDDRAAMHEALEGQTVTISKASIQATLRAETTVLAAANPKLGRFDPYETIAKQIDLPPTLINRFDLIFPIKDLPNKEKDARTAEFILSRHKDINRTDIDIPTTLIRKYVAYARQKITPKLTDTAIEEILEYYLKMRQSGGSGGVQTVPISARQLEALVRLSEASAKLRLSDKVSRKDAKKAVELLDFCLRQIAYDEKTGTIDIDRIATDVPATQRNKIVIIKGILADMENKIGKAIPIDDIIKMAEEKGVSHSETEELLQKLKRMGDIFEPKPGFLTRI